MNTKLLPPDIEEFFKQEYACAYGQHKLTLIMVEAFLRNRQPEQCEPAASAIEWVHENQMMIHPMK